MRALSVEVNEPRHNSDATEVAFEDFKRVSRHILGINIELSLGWFWDGVARVKIVVVKILLGCNEPSFGDSSG